MASIAACRQSAWAQGAGEPASVVNADMLSNIARDVATDLMTNLDPAAAASPGGRLKIAVRPFDAAEVDNLQVADRLNGEVEAALKAAGKDRVVIMERAAFAKVWAEANEFQGNDPSDRFRTATRDAGADVLVFGQLSRVRDGYSVAYRGVDVRVASTGAALAFTRGVRLLPATFAARPPLSIDLAIHDAGRTLARRLVGLAKLTDDNFTTPHSGAQNAVATLLLNRLEDELNVQIPLARRNAAGAQAFTGDAPAAPAAPPEIVISATPVELSAWLEVRFQAQVKDRGAAAAITVRIAKDDPALRGLLPLNRDGVFEASAEAVVKDAMDRDAAIRAARALARARVIAQKTNPLLDDTPVMVNGIADAATAMGAIADGITADEQWKTEDLNGGKRVRETLSARVKALGGGDAPHVRAVISAPVIESGQTFGLVLSSDTRAFVGVFGWTSDDLVLRAFPYTGHPQVVLSPNTPVKLPRAGEVGFASALRDGATADFEALIVVASAQPLAYDKIAMEPAATAEESIRRAMPIQKVFEALAKLTGNFSVSIVPYQLVAKP